MRCKCCGGGGKVLGGGMMQDKCGACKGTGLIDEIKPKEVTPIDKRSKSYKDAIKKIMDLDSTKTYQEATEIFDKEYALL